MKDASRGTDTSYRKVGNPKTAERLVAAEQQSALAFVASVRQWSPAFLTFLVGEP